MEEMGKIICDARKKKGLTQKDLSEKLNISISAISKWERGLCYPDISLIIPLTKILEITLNELFGENEDIESKLAKTINYSNMEIKRNQKKNLKKSILLVICTIIAAIVIVFRIFQVTYYNSTFISYKNYNKLVEGYKNSDSITIKNEKASSYISYENMKIGNVIDNFRLDYTGDSFVVYSFDNNTLTLSKYKTYLDMIIEDDYNLKKDDDIISKYNNKGFFNDNNILNDIDLIKYLISKNTYNNFFTSNNTMKLNYYIKYLGDILLGDIDSITYIDGDIKGYILNNTSFHHKEIHIIDNGFQYVIGITGDYFTDDIVMDILNTFSLEK